MENRKRSFKGVAKAVVAAGRFASILKFVKKREDTVLVDNLQAFKTCVELGIVTIDPEKNTFIINEELLKEYNAQQNGGGFKTNLGIGAGVLAFGAGVLSIGVIAATGVVLGLTAAVGAAVFGYFKYARDIAAETNAYFESKIPDYLSQATKSVGSTITRDLAMIPAWRFSGNHELHEEDQKKIYETLKNKTSIKNMLNWIYNDILREASEDSMTGMSKLLIMRFCYITYYKTGESVFKNKCLQETGIMKIADMTDYLRILTNNNLNKLSSPLKAVANVYHKITGTDATLTQDRVLNNLNLVGDAADAARAGAAFIYGKSCRVLFTDIMFDILYASVALYRPKYQDWTKAPPGSVKAKNPFELIKEYLVYMGLRNFKRADEWADFINNYEDDYTSYVSQYGENIMYKANEIKETVFGVSGLMQGGAILTAGALKFGASGLTDKVGNLFKGLKFAAA